MLSEYQLARCFGWKRSEGGISIDVDVNVDVDVDVEGGRRKFWGVLLVGETLYSGCGPAGASLLLALRTGCSLLAGVA